ncbi:glycerol-3-phosphate 1-O-acyltransferase PlsY [Dokdonella sp.]|mgnify:FL=1|uniref:glycerol-3-phosphate 1-O-acyltransferase PlsY n=1 Tax=Dokdonella sp. TaxID=2291710 RepID=UPI002C673DE8|nr:glycerol-3-phosphate 1-O-acyltransferase PlsY [Dokdonella sp.]HOX71909.1 glycerol-3-phosphate 1-O-acyltransferase PlsY [Dokdonella sp.]HPN78880.1 glycerol-3-phosphate 1-O-acyltransferase PlsY [Dokdonella sp.]
MVIVLAKLLLAYLLGSLSGSLLVGRLRGIDIRTQGSGNAGGTNALRVAGWRFALAVVIIDVGKGALAALLGDVAWASTPVSFLSPQLLACLCAFAAVIGHCWPVYFGFRGGKGAGTAVGAVLVLAPWIAVAMIAIWLVAIACWRYVGLATMLAGLAFPLLVWLASAFVHPQSTALLLFAIAIAVLLVFTHRSNLVRMRNGVEPRIGRKPTSVS